MADRDDRRAFFAAAGAFLGLNGLGQGVYRAFIDCHYDHPIFGCKSLAGGYGWPVGTMSEGEFTGIVLVVSIVCTLIAAAHDW